MAERIKIDPITRIEGHLAIEVEIENGKVKLTGKSRSLARTGQKRAADEYLKLQARFKKISQEQALDFQRQIDDRWEALLQRAIR